MTQRIDYFSIALQTQGFASIKCKHTVERFFYGLLHCVLADFVTSVYVFSDKLVVA